MQNKFSIYLTGFRKNRETQHVLLKMIETWKTKLNMSHKVGVIYMDQNAVEFFTSQIVTSAVK